MLFSGLLLAFATAASAQNYYVCDNGDDNNDGRSEATPFLSYEKAMQTFNRMEAGESVLFCRGGVFPAEVFARIANWKCSAEKPCTMADYGDAAKPAPTIVANGVIPLNFQNGGTSRRDGGYIVRNLTLLSKKFEHVGVMLYNDVNDVTLDNLHIEGFNVGVYSAGANQPEGGSNQANDRIFLTNSTIINNRKQGWLGGCNDCVIDNNHFENNGFGTAIFDHNVYIDSPVKSQDFYNRNIRFTNNTLLYSTRVDGLCQGASFVVHGIIKDLYIDGNIIREEAGKVGQHCWGIAVDPGNQLDESFVGLTITNNKLFNVGNLGIGCASCKNVLIADNIIVDEGNVLRTGIAVPNKTENSLKSENVTIRNNKIVANHDLAHGILLRGSHEFDVYNNEISLSSTDSRSRCIQQEAGNLETDVSRNTCDAHTSVKIIDEPALDTDVSQEEVAEAIVDQKATSDSQQANEEVASSEGATEVDETVFISPRASGETTVTESTTTETTASSGTTGGSSGGGTSSSRGTSSTSSSDAESTLADDGYTGSTYSNTSAAGTVETNDSGSTTAISDSTKGNSSSRSANAQPGNSSIKAVTIDDVKDVTENDISDVDESQCRVFARGRCMMM
ncbi:hypothetical protein MPL1_00075 [Methylophaga lonarensis MPL]|uniref:Right handed beta helix domain-containing protein n=2 Tax=Methylophaga lonarensis TaxID=999151 RepID=M7PV81_9GAMM|nr:hypothetical protein MPL1_00075 [Methylophaga lonarensis MPL]